MKKLEKVISGMAFSVALAATLPSCTRSIEYVTVLSKEKITGTCGKIYAYAIRHEDGSIGEFSESDHCSYSPSLEFIFNDITVGEIMPIEDSIFLFVFNYHRTIRR